MRSDSMNTPRLPIRDIRKNWHNSMAADDFRELFAMELPGLFRVALLISGTYVLAEASSWRPWATVSTGSVSRLWAPSWARRVVIRNAIGAWNNAVPEATVVAAESSVRNIRSRSFSDISAGCTDFARVIALGDLERTAFVLQMLERLTIRDCALLLNRSDREVRGASIRAFRQLAEFNNQAAQHKQSTALNGNAIAGCEVRRL